MHAPLRHRGQPVQVIKMAQKPDVSLAVLIDGENISAKVADELFEKVAALGRTGARRVYGDRENGKLKPWDSAVERHGILPIHVPTTGKNSTDIVMSIEAMDMLHSGRYDGFCLVSSDRDFIRLAERIRAQSCIACGFGEKKSSEKLVAAFSKFFVIGTPPPAKQVVRAQSTKDPGKPETIKSPEPTKTARALTASRDKIVQLISAKPAKSPPVHSISKPMAKPSAIERQAIVVWPWIEAALPAELDAWMTLSALGKKLIDQHPDYLQTTGFASLKAILIALEDKFEQGVGADGKTAQVRRRR